MRLKVSCPRTLFCETLYIYINFIEDCDIIFWLMSMRIKEYISAFSCEMCGMTSTGSLLSDPLDV